MTTERTAMRDEERAAFEAHITIKGRGKPYRVSGEYQRRWADWQAACAWQRERDAVRLEVAAERIKHTSHMDGLGMGWQALESELKDEVAAIRGWEDDNAEDG